MIAISYGSPAQGHGFLTLSGSMGPADTPRLRQQVSRALEGEPHDLVIDMREAYNVSRESLAMLSGVRARQRNLNRRLTLVYGIDSPSDRAMQAAGLSGLFLVVRQVPQS